MTRTLDQKSLSLDQYKEIMNEIWKYHRFGGLSRRSWEDDKRAGRCKYIKYVRPNWDMRDGHCFNIRFDEKEFDFRDNDKTMHENIIEWLNAESR